MKNLEDGIKFNRNGKLDFFYLNFVMWNLGVTCHNAEKCFQNILDGTHSIKTDNLLVCDNDDFFIRHYGSGSNGYSLIIRA